MPDPLPTVEDMDTLVSLGALWVAAAAAFTFGLARAAAAEEPFRLDADHVLTR